KHTNFRQGLAGGFALIEEWLSRFEAEDPNMERYTRVARGVMVLQGDIEGEEDDLLPK
ncbi:tigger transposable element-derived protein 1, partial [Biomphalaria glabrata]